MSDAEFDFDALKKRVLAKKKAERSALGAVRREKRRAAKAAAKEGAATADASIPPLSLPPSPSPSPSPGPVSRRDSDSEVRRDTKRDKKDRRREKDRDRRDRDRRGGGGGGGASGSAGGGGHRRRRSSSRYDEDGETDEGFDLLALLTEAEAKDATDSESDSSEFDEGDEELLKHFKMEKMKLVGDIGRLTLAAKQGQDVAAALAAAKAELVQLDKGIKVLDEKRKLEMVPLANPAVASASSKLGTPAQQAERLLAQDLRALEVLVDRLVEQGVIGAPERATLLRNAPRLAQLADEAGDALTGAAAGEAVDAVVTAQLARAAEAYYVYFAGIGRAEQVWTALWETAAVSLARLERERQSDGSCLPLGALLSLPATQLRDYGSLPMARKVRSGIDVGPAKAFAAARCGRWRQSVDGQPSGAPLVAARQGGGERMIREGVYEGTVDGGRRELLHVVLLSSGVLAASTLVDSLGRRRYRGSQSTSSTHLRLEAPPQIPTMQVVTGSGKKAANLWLQFRSTAERDGWHRDIRAVRSGKSIEFA